MYKLGVTGGIGSGKTTVSKFIKSQFNAVLFNADVEAKNHLISSTPLQKKVINTFGDSITNGAGKLNFGKLAAEAFKSKENQKLLNGLIWPEVRMLVDYAMEESQYTNELFIVDAPLIIEANMVEIYDTVLLITASEKVRFKRALARGTLSLAQIKARSKLQFHDQKKRKVADYIIDNNSNILELNNKLIQFKEWIKPKIFT